jgi:hypothetical protein
MPLLTTATVASIPTKVQSVAAGDDTINIGGTATAPTIAVDPAELDINTIGGSPLDVANGGTGAATLTANSLLLGNGTGAISALGAATDGQLVIGDTGGVPVLATLTEGTNIDITNAAGSITVATVTSPTFTDTTTTTLKLVTGFTGNLIQETTENLSADRTISYVVNNADFQFFLANSANLDTVVLQDLTSLSNTVTTTDATPTNIIAVSLLPYGSVTIEGIVVGNKTDGTTQINGRFLISANADVGGTAVLQCNGDAGFQGNNSINPAVAIGASVVADALQLAVIGLAATDIKWRVQYTMVTEDFAP